MTRRHQRRTPLLGSVLEAVALALAGRAGSRLAGALPAPLDALVGALTTGRKAAGTSLLNVPSSGCSRDAGREAR